MSKGIKLNPELYRQKKSTIYGLVPAVFYLASNKDPILIPLEFLFRATFLFWRREGRRKGWTRFLYIHLESRVETNLISNRPFSERDIKERIEDIIEVIILNEDYLSDYFEYLISSMDSAGKITGVYVRNGQFRVEFTEEGEWSSYLTHER